MECIHLCRSTSTLVGSQNSSQAPPGGNGRDLVSLAWCLLCGRSHYCAYDRASLPTTLRGDSKWLCLGTLSRRRGLNSLAHRQIHHEQKCGVNLMRVAAALRCLFFGWTLLFLESERFLSINAAA